MNNGIEDYEDHPVLSEFGFWKYKTAIQIQTLGMALAALDHSVDLDAAKDSLRKIRDSYELSSWPRGISEKHTSREVSGEPKAEG